MKGIELCAECAYYNMKSHKCTRGCKIDPDSKKCEDVRFFVDCPLPDVQPVKHGEWKINSDGYYPYCSVCGTAADQLTKHLTKYCPECGARMNDKHNHTLVFNPKQLAGLLTGLKELREENKDWKEEYAYINKVSYGYYKELKEAKRLLKAAVDDFRRATQGCIGIQCDSCPHIATHSGCVWRYADEVLKLIEEEEE